MRLKCDIGESFGAWTMGLDEQVMPVIDQANIAYGVTGFRPPPSKAFSANPIPSILAAIISAHAWKVRRWMCWANGRSPCITPSERSSGFRDFSISVKRLLVHWLINQDAAAASD